MADCCSAPGLMPLSQALAHLLGSVSSVTELELIDIHQADGRVIAEPVESSLNVPAFNNSAMDGYAICASAFAS